MLKYQHLFPQLKQNCLIIDIETSSFFPTGQEINISYQFEEYVQYAQVK